MPSPPARSLNDKVLSLENRLEKELEELKAGQALTAFYLGMRCVGGQGRAVPRLGPGHGPPVSRASWSRSHTQDTVPTAHLCASQVILKCSFKSSSWSRT